METAQRCLKLGDAAKYIGVSISTFKRMVARGEAPAPIRMSKRLVVWDKKQLDSFVERMADF
tara:strand:- start:240 stop:425 length:186 start_codon:yes stop_codon:yes gene_type:complete